MAPEPVGFASCLVSELWLGSEWLTSSTFWSVQSADTCVVEAVSCGRPRTRRVSVRASTPAQLQLRHGEEAATGVADY